MPAIPRPPTPKPSPDPSLTRVPPPIRRSARRPTCSVPRRPAMNRAAPEQEAESSLMDHLIELRTRLVRGLMGVGVVLLVLLPFVKQLYDRLAMPMISQ